MLKIPIGFWGDKTLTGFLHRLAREAGIDNDIGAAAFATDNLFVFGRHVGFRSEKRFADAVRRHARTPNDLMIAWRTHTVCWAARNCLAKPGDFVEAGTADGYTPLVMLDYLDAVRDRRFWLYDAFDLPISVGFGVSSGATLSFDAIENRFAPFRNVELVRGILPDSLDRGPETIAFLHLDLGEETAEAGTLSWALPRLAPGGWVVAESYGFLDVYERIKPALDALAGRHGCYFYECPTGQGILVKPDDGAR